MQLFSLLYISIGINSTLCQAQFLKIAYGNDPAFQVQIEDLGLKWYILGKDSKKQEEKHFRQVCLERINPFKTEGLKGEVKRDGGGSVLAL